MRQQSAETVLVIVPLNFGSNPETIATNEFQKQGHATGLPEKAREETICLIERLRDEGVEVIEVMDRNEPVCPDAVFSNNWIGVTPGNKLFVYKMMSALRQLEERQDLVDLLVSKRKISEVFRVSEIASGETEFLEGTGSIVFDHINKIGYAARSPRTGENLVKHISKVLSYDFVLFDTVTPSGQAVYHTNVMLSIGSEFVVVAPDVIHVKDRDRVMDSLKQSGRSIIEISMAQMFCFAGNVLEVRNHLNEKLIVISSVALQSLELWQIAALQNHGLILEVDVSTIEQNGGGSVRCMITEIF
jgi:hypothetical protein